MWTLSTHLSAVVARLHSKKPFSLLCLVWGWERKIVGFLTIFSLILFGPGPNVITTKTISLTVWNWQSDFFCVWLSIKDGDMTMTTAWNVENKSGKRDLSKCVRVCTKSDHYNSYCTKYWSLSLPVAVVVVDFFSASQKQCTIQHICIYVYEHMNVWVDFAIGISLFDAVVFVEKYFWN